MNYTIKTPYHRIEEPISGLAVRFICKPAPAGRSPNVTARLTAAKKCTPFGSRIQAEQCFARYLVGQPLEIVRVDA